MSKKSEYRSLLTILAINNPDGCADILRKNNEETAYRNHKDLAIKLANLYAKSSDKVNLEKDFANAHPHKDFILKYNKPAIKEQEHIVIKDQPVIIEIPEKNEAKEEKKEVEKDIDKEKKSSVEGEAEFICKKCGETFLNVDSGENKEQLQKANNNLMILGVVSVFAIVTLAICLRK